MNFSPLPLYYKDVKRGSAYSVTTYCVRCRRETVHALYEEKGGLFKAGALIVECLGYGRPTQLGR